MIFFLNLKSEKYVGLYVRLSLNNDEVLTVRGDFKIPGV